MFVLAYKASYDNQYSVSSVIYPTLHLATKALEVRRFESPLQWSIFQLIPVADSSEEVSDAA